MNKKIKCPFAVYDLDCDKPTCDDCTIRIEALTKENETISENMRDYWKCIRSGAEK